MNIAHQWHTASHKHSHYQCHCPHFRLTLIICEESEEWGGNWINIVWWGVRNKVVIIPRSPLPRSLIVRTSHCPQTPAESTIKCFHSILNVSEPIMILESLSTRESSSLLTLMAINEGRRFDLRQKVVVTQFWWWWTHKISGFN